jgi:hypothetical protein
MSVLAKRFKQERSWCERGLGALMDVFKRNQRRPDVSNGDGKNLANKAEDRTASGFLLYEW